MYCNQFIHINIAKKTDSRVIEDSRTELHRRINESYSADTHKQRGQPNCGMEKYTQKQTPDFDYL